MCGIAGIVDLSNGVVPRLAHRLDVMNDLQRHRGPDGLGTWTHEAGHVGIAHRRLAVLDLSTGDQPMTDVAGNWISFNGEIYNYRELRAQLPGPFRTTSDTEVILAAYREWGPECPKRFRGMFTFLLWDDQRQSLFCARDRFGIKPLYWTTVADTVYLASEVKALLPFVPEIRTDHDAFMDYTTFQFCLPGKTLFEGIHELAPGHTLTIERGRLSVHKYWDVYFDLDWDHTSVYFEEKLRELLDESVGLHVHADVPVGAYVSGGLDSAIVATAANQKTGAGLAAFHGRFPIGRDYDESAYAQLVATDAQMALHVADIGVDDFIANIPRVIYHLDFPTAGPGSFSQFMVSKLASQHRKVVLGGQGGDEIFGGYTRYLVAYFEQCIKAAIDGTMNNGNFVVSYESIIPNLTALQSYKPMLTDFWREGLFEDMDRRYFRLVSRFRNVEGVLHEALDSGYSPFRAFGDIFNAGNVSGESYFDRMTHFDFKTLLPSLLHVEDRMSMAFGVESRLPLLDHPLVELAATIPADVKFKDGEMKAVLRRAFAAAVPGPVLSRKDKMGFPTPVNLWFEGSARDFVCDTLSTPKAKTRELVDNSKALDQLGTEGRAGRSLWGVLSLEIWQQEFHDRAAEFRALADG